MGKTKGSKRDQDIVRTVPELVDTLQVSFDGKQSSYYYYTTLSSLALMLGNGMFRLSNIKSARINDRREYTEFGPEKAWERICIGCFSADCMESNAMWRVYGNPADEAIAIRIPSSVLAEMAQGEIHAEVHTDKKKSFTLDSTPSSVVGSIVKNVKVLLHEIAYFPSVIRWDENKDEKYFGMSLYRDYRKIANFDLRGHSPKTLQPLMGYVKRWQWMYEREVRLHVELPPRLARQNVYLKLPDDFWGKVSIVLGPCFNVLKFGNREKLLTFAERSREGRRVFEPIIESAYFGQLNYPEYGNGRGHDMPRLMYHGVPVSRENPQAQSLYEQYVRLRADM